MAKMKDRLMRPPYGWQFHQPQTGYSIPDPDNKSFEDAVRLVIEHRRGNPWIVQQHNLSLDESVVGDEIDSFNAERMRNNPAWMHFLSDASPSGGFLPRRLSRSSGAAVAVAKKTAAGVKVILNWLGEGLRPVEQALAEKRASRCIECPQNTEPNFLERFETAAAEEIKKLSEIKNDMQLRTPHDAQLHMCAVCQCVMRLKVWVPIKHISNETKTETLNKLSAVKTKSGQGCWVPEEISAGMK